jgi:hypothetical protein
LEPTKFIKAEILVDPAKDAIEMQQKQMEEGEKERQEEKTRKKAMALGTSGMAKTKKFSSTSNNSNNNNNSNSNSNNNCMIGKYLPKSVVQSKVVDDDDDDGRVSNIRTLSVVKPKAPPPTKTKFGNFSGW